MTPERFILIATEVVAGPENAQMAEVFDYFGFSRKQLLEFKERLEAEKEGVDPHVRDGYIQAAMIARAPFTDPTDWQKLVQDAINLADYAIKRSNPHDH